MGCSMDEDFLGRMNIFYKAINQLWLSVYASLDHRVFELESGYQPRHSYFNAQRERITDDYPLPYIVLKGFCEFQVEPTCLSCFTEVRIKDVSLLNDPAFRDVPFDVWGEDDCYELLYRSGEDSISLSEAIADAEEQWLVVHFHLTWEQDGDDFYRFAKLLRKRGFFIQRN